MLKNKMNNSISITIGIPAYKEEAHIARLLDNIITQKKQNFNIKKIIVVSDSRVDKTNEIVERYKKKNVDLVINSKRKGQIFAQNLIFKKAESDLVILFEADTYPKNKYYISRLINPILKNKSIGMVQGYMKPLETKTLIQKVLNFQFKIYSNIILNKKQTINPIPSGRGGRAFNKNLYLKLKWPAGVPEDEYAYLWCMKNKIEVVLERSAICYFSLPKKYSDYLKEFQKNRSAGITIRKYFSHKIIKNNMSINFIKKIKILFSLILNNPIYTIVYIFLITFANMQTKKIEFTDYWIK